MTKEVIGYAFLASLLAAAALRTLNQYYEPTTAMIYFVLADIAIFTILFVFFRSE